MTRGVLHQNVPRGPERTRLDMLKLVHDAEDRVDMFLYCGFIYVIARGDELVSPRFITIYGVDDEFEDARRAVEDKRRDDRKLWSNGGRGHV